MPLLKLANRTREISIFIDMIEDQKDTLPKILFLEAPRNFGKSWLLRRFSEICDDRGLAHLLVSLNSGNRNPTSFMEYVCEHLEICSDLCFDSYKSERSKIEERDSNIVLQRIRLRDNNTIQVNSTHYNDNILKQLQRNFFKDITSFSDRCIFLIDTYEEASESLGNWMEDFFLPFVCRNRNLIFVIAGQVIPNPGRIEWQANAQRISISGIKDPQIWYSFFGESSFLLPGNSLENSRAILEAFIKVAEGNPGELMRYIDILKVELP